MNEMNNKQFVITIIIIVGLIMFCIMYKVMRQYNKKQQQNTECICK